MYWSESELQLFFVYSHSLHWMLHYLIPSVIYVMNWESDVLLVLDKSFLMVSLVTLYLCAISQLSHGCRCKLVRENRVHTVCATRWRFQYLKKFTGGLASQCNQEELALLLQHIQVFECRNNAGLCLWFGDTLPSLLFPTLVCCLLSTQVVKYNMVVSFIIGISSGGQFVSILQY